MDELRQQAGEEDRDLRVAEVAQQPLAQRAHAALGRPGPPLGRDAARPQHLDPDPGEVQRARELERVERDLRGPEDGGDAERGRGRPDEEADRHADRGEDAERRPPTRAFFVTIAVSGPGMTISRTAMARNGSTRRCTSRSMPDVEHMILRLSLTLC